MPFKRIKKAHIYLLFITLVLINLLGVFYYDQLAPKLLRPSLILTMMIFHFLFFKKLNISFLLCQLTTLIGDYFQYNFDKDFFVISIAFYTIGQFFLIYSLTRLTKRKWKNSSYLYLVLCTLIFAIVFNYVIGDFKHNYSVILFGISFIFTSSIVYVNYMNKMDTSNLILLLASIASVLSASISTINLEHIYLDTPVFLLVTLFASISHYLYCLGFYKSESNIK